MQGFAAQVEEAVLQADFFGVFRLAEDRQRQFGGFRQHFNLSDIDLDFAGRQIGIDRRAVTRHHLAVNADHALGTQALHLGKTGR